MLIATVLTMVQKKSPFAEINRKTIEKYLSKLTEDTKPVWGIMSPQHMVEHLEYTFRIASGEIQDFEIDTPEKILEKVHDTLYNYKPMPRLHKFPLAIKELKEDLQHENLIIAKQKMLEAYDEFEIYFKENPKAVTKNVVFGMLNNFEWQLLNTKHLNHHFEQFNLL